MNNLTRKLSILMFAALLLSYAPVQAQRLGDRNLVAWTCSFNTIYLSKKVSLWVEYQWRREDLYNNWQQSLARVGLQYHINKDVSVLAGYGYIITYPYGDFQIGPYEFPEHRIFEQLIWNDNSHGRLMINHRLRLEQRLLGKVDQKGPDGDVNGYNYLNRVRYQVRLAYPLSHPKMVDKTWYAAAYDELMIGFGSNVNQNIFDQNRIGLLGGYQFSNKFKIEGGYYNQIVQQAGLVTGKQVYQYNNGLIVNVYYTRPFKEKKLAATNQ